MQLTMLHIAWYTWIIAGFYNFLVLVSRTLQEIRIKEYFYGKKET